MNRREIVLAALAPAKGAFHSPVEVQKLMFLIDRNIADLTGGSHFHFLPYNYGPFDKAVYEALETLEDEGLVTVMPVVRWREYALTEAGQKLGEEYLSQLPPKARSYIERASEFVRSLSFTRLVSAIYKAYPDMRANSVFQE